MVLDPQAAAYLEQARRSGVPQPSEVPLAEARRNYDQATPALFGAPEPVASVEDLDAHGVPVRVYRPQAAGDRGVVYCHGGGWVMGSPASHEPLCRTVAARSSCAVVAVDYRLAPEHPYPAAIDDAWTATRWAAERFPALALAGDSAGGQLAASVALRARDAAMPLALQALIYPITNHGFDTPSYRQGFDGATLNAHLMRWFWRQYLTDERRSGEPDCSPLRATNLAGVAPALVLTAEYDPLRDEGEAYARRLEASGVPVVLTRYDGQIHGFIRMPAVIDRAREAIEQVAAALRSALVR